MKKFEMGGKTSRKWAIKGVSIQLFSERRLLVEFGHKPRRSRTLLIAGIALAAGLSTLLVWQGPMFAELLAPDLSSRWFGNP